MYRPGITVPVFATSPGNPTRSCACWKHATKPHGNYAAVIATATSVACLADLDFLSKRVMLVTLSGSQITNQDLRNAA